MYKRAIDGTFLRCVDKAQQTKLLESFHDKACGGHFSAPVTAHKILRAKYYWPTLFQDAFPWVRKCVHCQQFVGKPKLAALPLKPVIVEEPFRQWGIDFIGVINPPSSAGHSYVLIATDYFTKWVEAIPVKNATFEIVCRFLKENIISRFGVPFKIVTDNAATFSSSEISQFCLEYNILLTHSSDYYPQGNGQAESSNKNLITIIRKLVEENQRSWHKALFDALWADKITPKRAIGMSPFQLLYGINAEIPITLELPALKLAKAIEDQTYENALDKRIMYLSQLEEQRTQVVDRIAQHQQQVKVLFDKKAKQKGFQVGDCVFLWDKRREPKGLRGKFDSLWRGPFTIHRVAGEDSFILVYHDGTPFAPPYNGQHLKHYFE